MSEKIEKEIFVKLELINEGCEHPSVKGEKKILWGKHYSREQFKKYLKNRERFYRIFPVGLKLSKFWIQRYA